jgi:hypothetical protein
LPEAGLAQRDLGLAAVPLSGGGKFEVKPPKSPPAWWAAFVLSGDWR